MVIQQVSSLVVLQGGSGDGSVLLLMWLALVVTYLAGIWKVFEKGGYPGWLAIIPILNLYIMLRIGDNKGWWLLILFIPIVNLYGLYKMFVGVSRAFGQDIGFALGLWFLGFIFWPLLGFGEYTYQGPSGNRRSPRNSTGWS